MMRNVELVFVRKMMENMMDQGDMATVQEMSRRIDEIMNDCINAQMERHEPAV